MSILDNLARAQKAHRQQPLLASEAELVAEYDAARRAYKAALACNDVDSALLWSDRANNLARQMAWLQDRAMKTACEPLFPEQSGGTLPCLNRGNQVTPIYGFRFSRMQI
ncbi:MAG: hypothetical protein JXB07_21920 [Anaerolineae bacterium]|nr:hypothetical protein [Anaerolineae bacterium]